MVIPLMSVGQKLTAAIVNQIIGGVNQTALAGIAPTSVAGTGVTASANGVVTFTNATAVSLNGVLSGTYDNYRITWSSSTRSQNVGLYFRLRQAGTDVSTATYDWVQQTASGTTSSVASSSSATGARIDNGVAIAQRSSGVFDLFGPALSGQATLGTVQASVLSASALTSFNTSLACETTTSSDGITIYAGGTSTFSGVLRVYGYNNLT